MEFDFLKPVDDYILALNQLLPKQSLGRSIKIHTLQLGLPSLEGVRLVLFGVSEFRGGTVKSKDKEVLQSFREEFYKLYPGNWHAQIADLGDIIPGESLEDTYYAIKTLVAYLIKQRVVPIVIGGSQDLTFAVYRAFDQLEQMVNLVSVDSRFDFGMDDELISTDSYMSKIVMEQPTNLFNYSNIGYQNYFNAQEELDLMERLFFETYRLGNVISDVSMVEPILRDADLVSVDMTSVQGSTLGGGSHVNPNGFNGREICAISRYAGISDKVAVFGLFETQSGELFSQLEAQIIWYFIEGFNFRANEYPFTSKEDYTKYIVPTEEVELQFFRSNKTDRWWIEIPMTINLDNKLHRLALLPCTHQDYLDACNDIVPERWWRAYKKNNN